MKPTTILLVAGSAGFSTRDVWEGYREGLAQCGVQVIPYATFSLLRILSQEAVGNDIIGKAHDVRHSVDAVVFIDGLFFRGEREWVPLSLRKSGMLTAVVKTDDPYAPITNAHHLYDVVLSNELAGLGDHEMYLPTATLEPPPFLGLQKPQGVEGRTQDTHQEASDVVFVGTLFEDRVAMMMELAQHCAERGLRLRLAGNFPVDAPRLKRVPSVRLTHGTVSAQAKWRMYSHSKLVVNLFRQANEAVSPNPRVFEVTALGGPALLSGPRRAEVTHIYGESVYQFDNAEEMKSQVDLALADDHQRAQRVVQAQSITLGQHLYRHRAQTLLHCLNRQAARPLPSPAAGLPESTPLRGTSEPAGEATSGEATSVEEHLAWIIGCGRTGSTWLCEMVNAIPGFQGWHEPYFGRLLQHLSERPEERRRPQAFFFDGHRKAGLRAVRSVFFQVAGERYPGWGREALVVKEVNTPEFFPVIEELFPASALILLVRDPFDILDSYLDMRRPGSWNYTPGKPQANTTEHLAQHIADTLGRAIESFGQFTSDRKLMLRYEEMLVDPVPTLQRVCELLGHSVSSIKLSQIVQEHAFAHHQDTGPGAFRRFGHAGIWKTSGNFDESVREVANRLLGDLRLQLRYN